MSFFLVEVRIHVVTRRFDCAYTVKKGLPFSRPRPGCHLPNSPWTGIRENGKPFFTVYRGHEDRSEEYNWQKLLMKDKKKDRSIEAESQDEKNEEERKDGGK